MRSHSFAGTYPNYPAFTKSIDIMNDEKNVTIDDIVWSDPKRVSGTPLFRDSRVPVRSLIDWLEGDYTVAEFLAAFPGITREQVHGFLEIAFREQVEPLDRTAETEARNADPA